MHHVAAVEKTSLQAVLAEALSNDENTPNARGVAGQKEARCHAPPQGFGRLPYSTIFKAEPNATRWHLKPYQSIH